MAEQNLAVCRVGEESWGTYREVRLDMLRDAPAAFGGTYAESAGRTEAAWRQRLRTMPTWLACAGSDEPAGAVSLFRFEAQAQDEICLIAMWVRPLARGRGVGDLLVETAVQHAATQGLSRVTLDVAVDNLSARRLYERRGFRPTGRTGALPHDPGVAEVEMARQL
jgi:ribosomal protein S18 acetylase RimI-like enzyme